MAAYPDARRTSEPEGSSPVKRRGILAAAGAALAAIAVTRAAQPVGATTTDTNFVANGTSGTGFQTTGTFTTGVSAKGSSFGVSATATGTGVAVQGSSTGTGVLGITTAASNSGKAGVFGVASQGAGNIGVVGDGNNGTSNSVGVRGQNAQTGVHGKVANTLNTIAVYGDNRATTPNAMGVAGTVQGSTASGTIGVYGANANTAANSHGIVAFAANGHGLFATTNAHPNNGVPYAAVFASAGVTDANAGTFQGNVSITGDLTITGNYTATGTKSAALAYPDGSHRLVYCIEAPEAWLEDFGEGTLTNGSAEVRLDPNFVAVADMTAYHVFLTSYDPTSAGLAVGTRAESGFMVQEHAGGTSRGTFSWRVVAKRRDVKAARLAKVDLANPPRSSFVPPPMPDLPTLPTPTDR
jgi:hypothetical protein